MDIRINVDPVDLVKQVIQQADPATRSLLTLHLLAILVVKGLPMDELEAVRKVVGMLNLHARDPFTGANTGLSREEAAALGLE